MWQLHHRQQLENVNTTQANIHQVIETEVNEVTETEEGNQCHRLQSAEVAHEITQEANGEYLQNCINEAARGSIEDNAENISNTNSSNNQSSTENNCVNIGQVPKERNENSQIYSMVNLKPNVNIPQQPVPSQNRSKLSKISQNYFKANSQPSVNTPHRIFQHEINTNLARIREACLTKDT